MMPTRDFHSTSKKTNQDYYVMGSNQIETLTRYNTITRYNRAQTMLFIYILIIIYVYTIYIFIIIYININLYLLRNLCINKYYYFHKWIIYVFIIFSFLIYLGESNRIRTVPDYGHSRYLRKYKSYNKMFNE